MPTNMTAIKPSTRKGITGSTLKIIAIITMFIDHIGAAILEHSMIFNYISQQNENAYITLRTTDLILRLIGRIAFPIFCFLLVEGFFHTRDVKKYALRYSVLFQKFPLILHFLNSPSILVIKTYFLLFL